MAPDTLARTAAADAGCGGVASDAWNPGLQSQVPAHLRHLCTIFRPEHSYTGAAEAAELQDLTGLPASELVAFRPRRLALHEILIRVTANLSVPDGSRIEDLGINFRRMTQALVAGYIEPQMAVIDATYDATRRALSERIESKLPSAVGGVETPAVDVRPPPTGILRGLFWRRQPTRAPAVLPSDHAPDEAQHAHPASDQVQQAAERALSKVISALLVRHGRVWGSREMVASVAVNLACNDLCSEEIGRLIDGWLEAAATELGYRLLPRQQAPVVMNTKGPSASGKSTLRPLQKKLAGDIGVNWSDFALISPDIWRKQLIDYEALGPVYKYGATFTGEELGVVDHKLDRYMARKAARHDMPHLLIDRFRFDSFAPDSNEAGSNLLTRFGQIVYLFFLITPPDSLVERAWKRGLEVGRYKAVDDTLAHSVEAYSGMPELFFTWIRRTDKRVHFEFLDNTVQVGERPRTVAFGGNDTLNVLDVKCMLDVVRYCRVDINATAPSLLYADRESLAPENNTRFLSQCVERFRDINFADQATGRIYLRMISGRPSWADHEALEQAISNMDTRAGIAAVAPDVLERRVPAPERPTYLHEIAGAEIPRTLGRWGSSGSGTARTDLR